MFALIYSVFEGKSRVLIENLLKTVEFYGLPAAGRISV